jgi:hypothetical protein
MYYNTKTKRVMKKELLIVATDYDVYCDYFGGKNLESREEFENGDLNERIKYLQTLEKEYARLGGY